MCGLKKERKHALSFLFPHVSPDEVSTRQCPLLWTWVLEKMGMLEIAERLANKQHGTRGLPKFRPPEEKPYSCLSALDYGGTGDYRGAQMRSGVEVCMRKYEGERSRSFPPGLYIDLGRSQAQI